MVPSPESDRTRCVLSVAWRDWSIGDKCKISGYGSIARIGLYALRAVGCLAGLVDRGQMQYFGLEFHSLAAAELRRFSYRGQMQYFGL